MNPVRAILIYIASVFLGGALLAPWLYAGVQWLDDQSPALQTLADKPFHRYLSRSLLIISLAGLWPFIRAMGIGTWKDLGLARDPQKWRSLRCGFLIGFGSLAILVLIALLCGARSMSVENTSAMVIRRMLNAGFAAVLVAFLEELLFRGAIFGGLRKVLAWKHALWVSSLVYAMVHFLGRPEPIESIRWTSGLAALGTMASGFIHVGQMMPALVNLTIAGMILAIGFQKTGSLFFSIGLHGGWIFWVKSFGFLFVEKGHPSRSLWGSEKLIDGWIAMPILLLCLALVWGGKPARDLAPGTNEDSP